MSEVAARARLADLQRRIATPGAIEASRSRLDNLRRLRLLRDRCAAELEEVGELIDQLTAQAELVRLSGAPVPAGGELVRDAPYPGRQSKNLMDDQHYGCLGAPLRIDHPHAQTVSVTRTNHRPFAVAW